MAQSKIVASMTKTPPTRRSTAEDKIAPALAQASAHAKRQLALQGLKLPTQSWKGSAVRNPAV